MNILGWCTRSIVIDSGSFMCPGCEKLRSVSTRELQRAFCVLGIPMGRWRRSEEPAFAECEHCGEQIPGNFVLHSSSAIAKYEMAHDATDESEELLEQTRPCPHCGRELGLTTTICPRCEMRVLGQHR